MGLRGNVVGMVSVAGDPRPRRATVGMGGDCSRGRVGKGREIAVVGVVWGDRRAGVEKRT